WVYGESLELHDIDVLVRSDRPLLEVPGAAAGEVEQAIARHIGGLVEDGSTLQLGLGSRPEAVLDCLRSHRDLGIHSGAIGNKVADLMEAGVITNARKARDTGITVAGVLFGGERIYRYAHLNRNIQLRSTDYTHSLEVL